MNGLETSWGILVGLLAWLAVTGWQVRWLRRHEAAWGLCRREVEQWKRTSERLSAKLDDLEQRLAHVVPHEEWLRRQQDRMGLMEDLLDLVHTMDDAPESGRSRLANETLDEGDTV